jgi:hypothetical protein
MSNKDGFEIRVKDLVNKRSHRKEEIEQLRQQLDEELNAIESELASLEETLRIHYRDNGRKVKEDPLAPNKLQNMSVADAIEAVLKQSGGRERVSTIRKILLEKGRLKNPKTADGYIRGLLKRQSETHPRFFLIKGAFAVLPDKVGPMDQIIRAKRR